MRGLCTVWVVALAVSAAAHAGEPSPAASARAHQIVAILGLTPLVDRIESAPSGGSLEATLERLQLRDDVLAELQRVSLLINASVAQLVQEESAASSAHSYVDDGYTRAVASWNIAALMVGNGLSIVGTALQFDGTTQAYTGDGIILGGAALATAFSIVALTRRNQGRPPHRVETNFLAPLLGRTPNPQSRLPEAVWRYLDTPLPGERGSLRSQLVERWTERGSIPRGDSPSARRKIDLLTRPLSRTEVVPSDALEDRAEMLDDLRAAVTGMHVDLQELVGEVRAHHGGP